ncbi:hypothetical protein [Algirhabdus cladophorae]|uniref:hypothetical protein n=1 Tax=Algirhabdus cladophorae TaxID=3377108 RepID=UPI003B845F28
MIVRGWLLACALPLMVAACTVVPSTYASDELVAQKRYVHAGPTSLTLLTVLKNSSDGGAHLALMVNGSERVIFDPAGSFQHPVIPERGDVIIGSNPAVYDVFVDYHARVTYRVVEQVIEVSPAVAELALQKVYANGAVPQAMCSQSITTILSELPGFESIRQTWFPKNAMDQFGALPGVATRVYRDDDPDDKDLVLRQWRG